MPRTEAQDLATLARKAKAAEAAEARARKIREDRDGFVLAVQEAHGTTYARLAEAMGVTKDRITQVLRDQRRAVQRNT